MEDLPWIISRNSMFANKFDSNTFPGALDCLEQWHRNKVLNQATVPKQPSWLLANLSSSYFNSSAGTWNHKGWTQPKSGHMQLRFFELIQWFCMSKCEHQKLNQNQRDIAPCTSRLLHATVHVYIHVYFKNCTMPVLFHNQKTVWVKLLQYI